MTIAVVQSVATQGGTGGNWLSTFGAGVTAGDTLFLAVYAHGTASAISASNPTYNGSAFGAATQPVSVNSPSTSAKVFAATIMYPDVGTGGGTTVGATNVNGTVDSNVGSIAYEVSGLGAAPAVDRSSTGDASSGNISSGASGAIRFAPEFVLGASVGFGISQTAASGFTNLFNVSGGFCEAGYQIPTSSGGSFTYATNTGVSADWAATIITVSAAQSAVSGQAQPRATIPAARRAAGRAVWRGVTVQTVNAPPPVRGTIQPRPTVPVPRRVPARALWRGLAVPGIQGLAPRQQYRTPPRRQLARAVWRGITGQAYVAVPAPPQQPRSAPRRIPARVYIRFVPVATVNAAPSVPVSGQVQPRATVPVPRSRPGRAVWRGLAAAPAAVPGIAVPAPRQQPRPAPRRTPARAYIRFTPVTTTNAPAPPAVPVTGRPPRGDYDRNKLLRRRHVLPPVSLPVALAVTVEAPPAAELATGWPGVWPGPWPEPPAAPVLQEPEPVPEPEPPPPPPPRVPVYVRPAKITRRYPEGLDAWRR